jgi:hypothetical protein
VVHVLANQHQLVLGLPLPLVVVEGKALAAEVEDMALGAFVKPENALGTKHDLGQLVVEKVLKLANGKGAIAGKGQGCKPIDG